MRSHVSNGRHSGFRKQSLRTRSKIDGVLDRLKTEGVTLNKNFILPIKKKNSYDISSMPKKLDLTPAKSMQY